MTEDPAFYERALRRMSGVSIVLALAAAIAIGVRLTWTDAAGFAAAAFAAILNFHWWKRLTRALEPSGETPARPASAVFLGMRYLMLGMVCFVIIKFFGVNYLALIAGLLVPVAAALVEMVYELLITR